MCLPQRRIVMTRTSKPYMGTCNRHGQPRGAASEPATGARSRKRVKPRGTREKPMLREHRPTPQGAELSER